MKLTDNHPRVICFGESFWVIGADGAGAGGSPVTIARHLKMLGMEPALVTRVGIDDEGRRLIGVIENGVISTDYFQVDYEMPTGLAHMPANPSKQNGRRDAWDNITWESSFEPLAANAGFFVHGSLPARSEVSRKTLYAFFERTARRVFHMNLQPPFYTKEAIESCLKGACILQLTIAELELVTGWFAPFSSCQQRMRMLQDRFSIPYIIVPRENNGCLLSAEGIFYEHGGFGMQSGAGHGADEALLAGFLHQLSTGVQPQPAIEYACALASLVGATPDGDPVYDASQIQQIIHK